MSPHELKRLNRHELLSHLGQLVASDRGLTVKLLECLIEVQQRKAYVPEGYASLFQYSLRVLRMSEDMAFKRIRSARVAARYPVVLAMVADGRLHLTALVELAPYLRQENAAALFDSAAHKSRREIQVLLAQRFPKPDLPTALQPIGTMPAANGPITALAMNALEPTATLVVASTGPGKPCHSGTQLAPEPVGMTIPWPRVEPLAPERFALQLTISRATQEKLERAKALLGHAVPSGELAQVLDRALDALIEKLEKSKYAATDRPRAHSRPERPAPRTRHIPAAVRREVAERDGHRCTFENKTGHRCEATRRLEYDHIKPFANGGVTSAANLRLRCREHNQYAAEQEFGREFMDGKRERAKASEAAARIAKSRRAAGVKRPASTGDLSWIETQRGDC